MRTLSGWSWHRWAVRGGLILCCAGMLCLLTGCIVAALAPAAWAVTKVTQSSIKSSVKVKFDPPQMENREALAAISSMAIWPQEGTQMAELGERQFAVDTMALTEALSSNGTVKIFTPLTVLRTVQSNAIPASVQSMTKSEKIAAFQQVAEATGADAVFYVMSGSMKVDASLFKLGRNTMARNATIFTYTRSSNDFAWQQSLSVVVALSTKGLSETEIQATVAPQVAEKILEALGKKPDLTPAEKQ